VVGTLSASVVIPSYNNASVLAETLLALKEQTVPPDQFEVIIIDDGSTDATEQVVTDLALPHSFRYIRQSNQGAAVARNHGASRAGGDLLVFLDSDVMPDAILLEEHLKSHRRHDRALVVGRTRALAATDFDLFYSVLAEEVFSHDQGNEELQVTFQEALSRNLSLRRESFIEIGDFDVDFPRSGYEDVEFAYRASQLGFDVIYSPTASGVHHHTGTLEEVGRHMYNYQASAVLLMKKHPEIKGRIRHLRDKGPIHWQQDTWRLIVRKVVRRALALPPSFWLMKRTTSAVERWYPSPSLLRFMYWQVLGSYLFLGYREGLRRHGVSS
jgi:glycosyltransferase involved in cell wall biosynthesis